MATPAGDSIPLINIPHWDFEWQFYRFLGPLHVPAGALFKTEGVGENTEWNPLNTNDPPQEVTSGALTTDEMLLVYLIWSAYQEGDEYLLFGTVEDPATAVFQLPRAEGLDIQVSSNPVRGMVHVHWYGSTPMQAAVRARQSGVVWTGELSPGANILPAQGWSEGVYLLSEQGANLQRAQTVFMLTR